MTLEEFIVRLKALLVEAKTAGWDPDQICEVAEYTLQSNWHDESVD